MHQPVDLHRIHTGARVLQEIAHRWFSASRDSAGLLLLRDLDGLAGRLLESTADEWSEDSIRSFLSPLDVGVVDQCEQLIATRRDLPDQAWRADASARLLDLRLELFATCVSDSEAVALHAFRRSARAQPNHQSSNQSINRSGITRHR